MANEIRINIGFQVGTYYRGTGPQSFNVDLVNAFLGPSPGAVSIPLTGYDVDVTQFDDPGYMEIWNQDSTNPVDWGLYDPDTNEFYPIGRVSAGRRYVIELSPDMLEEWASWFTGTGTGAIDKRLRFRPKNASVNCFIGIFNR